MTPAAGDVTPFLKQVEYLFPGERPEGADADEIYISQDGNILLDYLPIRYDTRRKVHWAVLVVGEQGTGKSYLLV